MKTHRLGSITPEEAERFKRLYGALSDWMTDDANVQSDDKNALANVLLNFAVQLSQQLKGDRQVFLDGVAALWDAKKKGRPS